MFSLLALLDDIATTLDDVAVMSKVAVQKTSALMADDLAVNAGVIDGVDPARELPIVKSIFYGSLLNKVYCIIGVMALMAIYPPLINAIMLMGGLYLSYEGVHKILDKLFHKKNEREKSYKKISEKDKIAGAIRTDLILSIEIIVLAKSTLSGDFLSQVLTLIAVGLAASIMIYGLVAIVVKIDDLGLHLIKQEYKKLGLILVNSMPYTMRILGVVGTVAMLLVGGGIIRHIFHLPHFINSLLLDLLLGLTAGLIIVVLMKSKDVIFKKN